MLKNIKVICYCCNIENIFSEGDIDLASKPEGIECNQCGKRIKARINNKKISRGIVMSTACMIGSVVFGLTALLSIFFDTGDLIYYISVPYIIIWIILLINNAGTNVVMDKIINNK